MTTTYLFLMYVHIITVVPCIFLGAYLLIVKKGTKYHRSIGKIYMILMFFTAFISLFLPAQVGNQFLNHFGFIHLFSFLTLYTVPTAIMAIRRGKIKVHKRKMILLYFGALIIAGGFTLAPGRYLNEVFFG
ncbi:hypothetical protein HME9304_00544 [Flagellimonas maritima]|uniref:DUF2306 domain-containing protein n=1 Tax=Flagellimonas maritima TaxID=1383885 RepID=A0A2Z4LNW5_9FLAO|nr:DUF2306 domain-containing protein [Allomuricauda aurantiaca]AWX43555.1 hypothetical protein HME9304_00544 [Allomuricauda aurantiaca]